MAKAVLKGAVGDYWHVIRYADTLNPLKKKTDSEVYNYGRAVGSVATDIVLAGRTAHESKVGYVAATDFIKKQAAKDAELLATKQVDEVVWHFFRSADTQKIGPSAPLKKLLENYGIKVVIYE